MKYSCYHPVSIVHDILYTEAHTRCFRGTGEVGDRAASRLFRTPTNMWSTVRADDRIK